MKKISLAIAAMVAALGFTSCNETWDDNPVLATHEGQVKADFLNEPAMQATSVMITRDNGTSNFNLTCSQPDFGYAAAAAYVVQLAITEDFSNFVEIKQRFYNCKEINPVYSDVAAALETVSGVKSEADLPLPYQKVYMRLRAFIPQLEKGTEFISNPVSFDAISADYLAIWVSGVPVNLYVRGDMNGWGAEAGPDAETPGAWQLVTGEAEDSWTIKNITILSTQGFKVADANWGDTNLGAGTEGTVTPGVPLTLSNAGSSGNLNVKEDFHGDLTVTLSEGIYKILLTPAN